MAKISIVAISDNVCPHCYIGHRRLQRAISLYRKTIPNARNDTITTTWQAYQLDATTPVGVSQPLTARITSRWGEARVPEMKEKLFKQGMKEGMLFNFDNRIGNTRDSHRVVVLAREKGDDVQNSVVEEIMRMYFEEGGDITSHEDLLKAAVRGGLDEQETREWLESDGGGDEVDREVKEARDMGVVGVPKFIINGKFVVDGAHEVPAFLEQLALAKEEADGKIVADV